jgi:ABC-type multidrug transport system fused ATPase/permease subunit
MRGRDPERLELSRLGSGERGDRLGFRLVLRILLRCAPLLRGAARHLALLLAGWSALALAVAPLVIAFIGIWWNSVLGDSAPSDWQARLLGLAPFPSDAPLAGAVRLELAERLSLLGCALALPIVVATFGLYYYQIWILQRINQDLRLRLLDRLQALSLRFHADSRVGDAVYRTYQDSAMVTQLVEVLFLTPLTTAARWGLGWVGVLLFDPWLAVGLAVLWGPALLLGRVYSQRLRALFRAAREANSALTSRIQESLAGIRVIKAYGLEGYEQSRFERDSLAAFGAAYEARNRLAVFRVAMFWLVSFAALAAFWRATLPAIASEPLFVWNLVRGSGLRTESLLAGLGLTVWSLGAYNSFKWLFGQATGSLERVFRVWGGTQDIAIGLDRVFEILDLEPEVLDAPDAVEFPGVRESIAWRDVGFRYQPDRPVLEGVSLEARAGTICAIVGPTGAGKSTLLALLVRLFDPERGALTIDGRDLREFRVESLRRKIAIALQENVLFATTVRENIRYAVPDAADEAVVEAARVACADEFIRELPDGYDALLGERGTKLSTGQRQRLSIARAILKDAPILILDEPTASLDAETELRLLDNLAVWGKGRVIFLITHRLSTIRRADQIVYLDRGRILETGSHADLLARPEGPYRALFEAEAGRVAEAGGGA